MSDDELLLVGMGILLMMELRGIDWGGGWVWPVPNRPDTGAQAVISQEFRSPGHLGVDIMFYKPRGFGFEAPPGTLVLAAKDGTVWSVAQTSRGRSVVLDHGPPFATFYQHLDSVAVQKGDPVKAGQLIGVMGIDPTDAEQVRHLHFAVWYKGNGDNASVDPSAMLSSARRRV